MTPDKDYGQLVSDNVFMYRPKYGDKEFEVMGIEQIKAKFDIQSPAQVIDMLGLMGDSSDNIPGCPGVGEKTAQKLIAQYGSIENLLSHTDELKGALKTKVETNRKMIEFSKFLACNRYANESFFIYDSTHKDLLLYSSGRSRMMRVDSLQLALPGEEELCFRALWKRFYETVAIRERENPRCQNTFLPKRYRGTMTEFLPLDYERQQQNLPSSHDVANGAIIRMIDSIELPPTTSLPEHCRECRGWW